MKMALQLILEDLEFFELIDGEKAEAHAESVNGEVYTWKTTGRWNWLEHGFSSIADVAGLVVLPRRLPDHIEMPDDPVEEGDDEDEDEE